MLVQLGLCQICSETTLLVFPRGGSGYYNNMFIYSEETKKLLTIIIPSVCGVALLGSLLALFGYYWQRRAKAKENTAKLTARMTGNLEEEVCNHISHVMRKLDFRVCENKGQISREVTAQLISAFIFATKIVQFLFYLNPKFQASSLLLRRYRPVCVRPEQKP